MARAMVDGRAWECQPVPPDSLIHMTGLDPRTSAEGASFVSEAIAGGALGHA